MPADLNGWMNNKNGNDNEKKTEPQKFEPPKFIQGNNGAGIIIIIAIIVIAIMFKPWVVINSGEVGILATTGKFEQKPLMPGLHFFVPVIQKVYVIDTKVHMINYKRINNEAGSMADRYGTIKVYPAINVLDARGLTILVELSVSYRLNPQEAAYTLETYGKNWEDKIINPMVRDVVRNVIGRFPAEELPIKRNQIANMINSDMQKQLDKLKFRPVILESVQLRDIIVPQKIEEQIEAVQIAKQQAERVKYEVLRAKQEAEKKAALAKGIADAKKIQAQGEADAVMIKAKAEADANIMISNSLTPQLLKLKEIEVQGKFNEALKVNKDAQIFLTPGGAVPNIWLDVKDRRKAVVNGR